MLVQIYFEKSSFFYAAKKVEKLLSNICLHSIKTVKNIEKLCVGKTYGAKSKYGFLLMLSGQQVMGESRRKEEYFCFPEHFCACYSFFYDTVNRGEQLCVSEISHLSLVYFINRVTIIFLYLPLMLSCCFVLLFCFSLV